MHSFSKSRVRFVFVVITAVFGASAHVRARSDHNTLCNQDGSLCVSTDLERAVVEIPLYFETRVKCPNDIVLGWELRDNAGKVLDQDRDGSLTFLVARASASERTIGVRDFALAPAKSNRGMLTLRATAIPPKGRHYSLPELSIPVHIETRTSNLTYAVPADQDKFSQAVNNSVENPSHRIPIRTQLDWRTKTVLHVRPGMLGGAAAEAAARGEEDQSRWNVIDYSSAQGTAHLTIIGDGWAGVTYYLAGLDYLLQKTILHQAGVQNVIFDPHPDFAR